MRISGWSSDVCSSDLAMVGDDGGAAHPLRPQAEAKALPGSPPKDRARDDEEQAAQPGDAGHPFAAVAREEMVVEIEYPQFGPLPLARPASHDTPRLVGVESGALAQGEAPLMQTEAVMSIDEDRKSTRLNSSH